MQTPHRPVCFFLGFVGRRTVSLFRVSAVHGVPVLPSVKASSSFGWGSHKSLFEVCHILYQGLSWESLSQRPSELRGSWEAEARKRNANILNIIYILYYCIYSAPNALIHRASQHLTTACKRRLTAFSKLKTIYIYVLCPPVESCWHSETIRFAHSHNE